MYNISIPEIRREELLERCGHIKPIIEYKGKSYFLRDYTEKEIQERPYNWYVEEDIREIADMSKYIAIQNIPDFECIHKTSGYVTIFTPTIAEVVAQIPECYVNIVDAFQIMESYVNTDDSGEHQNAFENGFNVSRVRLYVKVRN